MENPRCEEKKGEEKIMAGGAAKRAALRSLSGALSICAISLLFSLLLPLPDASAADALASPQQRYRILETSQIPDPKKSPYPDCLTHILCQSLTATGSPIGQPIDLVFTAFRNRSLYPASKLKPGDEVVLNTIPFHEASKKTRALMQVNDLPFSDASILLVSKWPEQQKLLSHHASLNAGQTPPPSNRDLIIQTLIAHQGKVTGGMIQDFFFWSHVPAMYESNFWKTQTTRKGALGPLRSIILFKQHLEAKNIDLIFVPIPRSTTLYPGIATNIEYDHRIDGRINFAMRDFMDALKEEGVTCVDLTPTFLANLYQDYNNTSYPIYRRNDTHWAPSGVRLAADLIAETVKNRPSYKNLETSVTHALLRESVTIEKFPYSMPRFERPPSRRQPPESQIVYRISGENAIGQKLLKDNLPVAEIHLLGDSFANAYGSGAGQAGLHPHLVKTLKTPVNKIASASGGSAISPNQFARNADHSKAKIVIWTVGESFLAAPDIWSDIPLDRTSTLMLDKSLSQAKLSHEAITFHLATQKTHGSFIAIGDPNKTKLLPEESRILWKGVQLSELKKKPILSVSTWIKKTAGLSTIPGNYPVLWEVWINGKLFKQQSSPPDRGIFQQRKWKIKLDQFSGQTVDFELVCRRIDSSQPLNGQPCWILPEIYGAHMAELNSDTESTPTHSAKKHIVPNKAQKSAVNTTKTETKFHPLQITLILLLIGGTAGCVFLYRYRGGNRSSEDDS